MNANLKKPNVCTVPEALSEAFATIDGIANSLRVAMEYIDSIEPFELHPNSCIDASVDGAPCYMMERPNRKRLSDLEYAYELLRRVNSFIESVQECTPTPETADDLEQLHELCGTLDEAVSEAGLT
jgi:hypothetical protein